MLNLKKRYWLSPDTVVRKVRTDPPILISKTSGRWLLFAGTTAHALCEALDGTTTVEQILSMFAREDGKLRAQILRTVAMLLDCGFVEEVPTQPRRRLRTIAGRSSSERCLDRHGSK